MSVATLTGPDVSESEALLRLPDPRRTYDGVALLHELRQPRRLEFERRGGAWELTLSRPDVDRMEYMLALRHRGGDTEVVPDPTNPLRAGGPFGEKSVLEFPGYEPPAWVCDEDARPGELRELPLESRRLHTTIPGFLWSAADTDPAEPLPLLVVHDGPDYAQYSSLLRLLDHLVDFGEIPEARALLLPPPPDRNDAYSASARYSNAFATELLPLVLRRAPTSRDPVLLGSSLGALAALHVHWRNPGLAAGLLLQSGSFFRRRFDLHESRFGRFSRITRFVGQLYGGRGFLGRVPVTITCGTGEENLDNNRSLHEALVRRGLNDARMVEHRDAHNWISWRDVLAPHLPELLLRAWS